MAAKTDMVQLAPDATNLLRNKVSATDKKYLAELAEKISEIRTARLSATKRATKLREKIERTPEFEQMAKAKQRAKMLLEREQELALKCEAIYERILVDIPGESFYEKLENLRAFGGV